MKLGGGALPIKLITKICFLSKTVSGHIIPALRILRITGVRTLPQHWITGVRTLPQHWRMLLYHDR